MNLLPLLKNKSKQTSHFTLKRSSRLYKFINFPSSNTLSSLNMNVVARVLIIFYFLTGCSSGANQKLTIAASANMQYAIHELVLAFSNKTGIQCEVIVSSSGKLTAQIVAGAPYDVFVSADMKYPMILFNKGLTTAEPEIYAEGKLVLWSVHDEINPSIEILTNSQIKHIALANPKTAPYGSAAMEVMDYYQITDSVKPKLVYGESISQTSRFITSGAAQIGFTAKSVVLSPHVNKQGKWIEIKSNTYKPIAQGVVVLNNRREYTQHAKKFQDFLLSSTGIEILNKFGYGVPAPAQTN